MPGPGRGMLLPWCSWGDGCLGHGKSLPWHLPAGDPPAWGIAGVQLGHCFAQATSPGMSVHRYPPKVVQGSLR